MKQKMKQLMGILISLVMVLEGAGGLTVCAAEQTEPNAIEQRLKIDDVTYYNAKSWSFASSTQQFYYDLLSAPVDDSENGWAFQFSRAELWMYLALCLDPGCPDRDLLYMQSVITEHKLSPLKYIYNNGKDEFYTGIWYNGRHYDVFFRNLGIVALQPDASVKGNYISTTIDSSKSDGTYVSSVRNESNSYVTQTIDDSESGTVTMSNSVNGSESYSYTEGIKVGYEYDGIFNNVSAEISFSATQALQNGWSKSNTESKTYTNGTHNTRTVPPYSAAVMETGSSDIEVTTRYNCPVGLTYSVDILTGGTNDWNPDTDPNATTWNGKKYTFGPDARKDIFQRWLINGNSLTNLDREKIDWRWVGYGRRPIIDNTWLISPLSKYVPVSSAGAVIRETKNSTKTTCKEFVPLHPLKTIKIETPPDGTAIAGKISYDSYDYLQMSLPMGKSSYTRYFTLGGYNSQGGIFSTFNKDFGHWIVVDENGRKLGGDAPVTLDSATGKFTAVSPGKCYLKYLINEDKYVSVDTGERYLTNRDIEKPAIMEITVEEPEYTNKLEITGSYTGIVGMASESIEGEGKLQGGVFDETGEEVAEPYIWKARQLPSRGINLTEDGTVSFTKPGTFQVRIMTPDKKHYSEWYDVTAKRGDDSGYIIDDDDLPPVIDDEDYRIADKSAVIFVEGSFDGSANGEAVSLEGKDKLTVYAEDLSGQELPIKYEWEQMENEGLVLSKDGKAVFTKPGNYSVRVRSGEIYSDWVEITAKVPAEVKRAPVAIDRVFDGRTRNLVEPGVAVGGKIAYVVMIDPWSVPSEASFEEKWASEIPAATDAGTYYVWYKVVGDANHSNTTASCVQVTIAYPLWVSGVLVTDENKDNVLSDGKVRFTPAEGENPDTLNLSGANITTGYKDNDIISGIYYTGQDKLSIVLDSGSENTIGSVDIGIYPMTADLTISGTGKITASGVNHGIYGGGTIKIEEGNVTASETSENFTAMEAEAIEISGGTVNISAATGGIGVAADAVTIHKDSDVTVKGGSKAIDGSVINEITGTGWTDVEGTTGKTAIAVSTTGQDLSTYKKVQFPGKSRATITTAPTAMDLTYSGQAQELITAGKAEGGTMQYAIGRDGKTAPTSGWSTSIPTGTNPGTYYVWYKVVGDASHYDVEPAYVTSSIEYESSPYVPTTVSATVTYKVVNGSWDDGTKDNKTVKLSGYAPLTLSTDQIPAVGNKPSEGYKAGSWNTVPNTTTEINRDTTYTYTYDVKPVAIITKEPEARDLTATGEPQALVTAGEVTGGTIEYVLGTDDLAAPTAGWSTTIPTATDAGTYYVWYKAIGDIDHKDSAAECVVVTVKKAEKPEAIITKEPEARDLTATGEPQELVTAGEATGGTMQYSLGALPSTYSTSIPTATEAGIYYVWYKAVGDADHKDTGSTLIVVKVKHGPETLVYNGEEQELVKGGSAQGGTMVYLLGTDDVTAPDGVWTDKVPTGKEPGDYYVWYKVQGDENHKDTEPRCIKVTIVPDSQVQQFEELINTLPEKVTLENSDLVKALRALYDSLSDDQKKLIPEEDVRKLEAAEEKINELNRAAAERFTIAVNAIPRSEAGEGKGMLDAATEIYNNITEEQKALVSPETMALYNEAIAAFKKDRQFRSGDAYYKVLSNGDVTYLKPASKDITNVTVPNQVKKGKFLFKVIKVSNNAFRNCGNLKWAVIGKNVRVFGEYVFARAYNLKTVRVLGYGFKSGKVTNAFVKAGKKGKLTVKVPGNKVDEYQKLFTGEGKLNGKVEAA